MGDDPGLPVLVLNRQAPVGDQRVLICRNGDTPLFGVPGLVCLNRGRVGIHLQAIRLGGMHRVQESQTDQKGWKKRLRHD